MMAEQQPATNPQPRLQNVLSRLESGFSELTGEGKRKRRIKQLLNLFEEDPERAKNVFSDTQELYHQYRFGNATRRQLLNNNFQALNDFLNQKFDRDISSQKKMDYLLGATNNHIYETNFTAYHSSSTDKKDRSIELRDHFQEVATAYFLAQNRRELKTKGTRIDDEREARQTQAIIAFVEGRHVHLGTGEGKSSVIFPIATIVEALTSEKKSAIISTTDEILLSDLRRAVDKYSDSLDGFVQINRQGGMIDKEKIPEKEEGYITQELQQKMVKEALLYGKYTEKTKEEITNSYWSDSFYGGKESRSDFLNYFDEKKPTIVFLTERDLIFSWTEEKKQFLEKIPRIFMDEAHLPYYRNSPYHMVNDYTFFPSHEAVEGTTEWLLTYVVNHQLSKNDFIQKEGSYTLTDEAQEKIKNFDPVFGLQKRKMLSHPEIKNRYLQGIEIIKNKLELNDQEASLLWERIRQHLLNNKQQYADLPVELGFRLASLYQEKGLSYILVQGSSPQVRDSYLDQVLADHRYSSEVQRTISAKEEVFDFVPFLTTASATTHYQTFLAAVGKKISCGSGTLLFPDPLTNKIIPSTFGKFLEWATGSKIELISSPEIKKVPSPVILPTDAEAINTLITSVGESIKSYKVPTLIVSYDIGESKKIYEEYVKKYGGEKVRYLETKPSRIKEAMEYEEKAKNYYQMLADGQLDVIVSSGAAGIGVNIMISDGKAPDLKVVIHNMPADRQQLMQILGRIRHEGARADWFISRKALEKYISMYPEKTSVFAHLLGELDQIEIKQRFEKQIKDYQGQYDRFEEEKLRLILELIKEGERKRVQNDQFIIDSDNFIETNLNPLIIKEIRKYLETDSFIENEVTKAVEKEKKVRKEDEFGDEEIRQFTSNEKQRMIDWTTDFIGLPEDLSFEVLQQLQFYPETTTGKGKVNRQQLLQWLSGQIGGFLATSISSGWYEEKKRTAEELWKIIYKQGKISQVIPVQFVDTRIGTFLIDPAKGKLDMKSFKPKKVTSNGMMYGTFDVVGKDKAIPLAGISMGEDSLLLISEGEFLAPNLLGSNFNIYSVKNRQDQFLFMVR